MIGLVWQVRRESTFKAQVRSKRKESCRRQMSSEREALTCGAREKICGVIGRGEPHGGQSGSL